MAPDGKEIIDVSPPDEGLHVGILQKSSLQLGHEEVGIGGGHPSTHCCAVYLEVVLFPENKSIFV